MFLPTTIKEVRARGWDQLDVILFSGDAYIDHPAFGAAVVGRLLEAEGYRVAIVPQPNWRDDLRDFTKLGAPRLFFGVSGGAMDSIKIICQFRNLTEHVSGTAADPDFFARTHPQHIFDMIDITSGDGHIFFANLAIIHKKLIHVYFLAVMLTHSP